MWRNVWGTKGKKQVWQWGLARRFGLGVALVALPAVLGGCNEEEDANDAADEANRAELANPASEYCVAQGHRLEMRTDEEGNQYGVCIFADDSECEEWAYFRGDCAPGEDVKDEGEASDAEGAAEEGTADEREADETESSNGVGLANPASVYCEDQGYQLEIRADEEGNQYGVCIFADDSECEEWAFFRGECGEAYSYCTTHGARAVHRDEDDGSAQFSYQVCVFEDESECLVSDYMAGSCESGQCRRVSLENGCEAL